MSKMKGFLKSVEGMFQLAPKVTTVGREGCDLMIQSPNVDQQHAVVEYSDQEDCFVLQDLNSTQGTFVNDCRVQNAAVRLAPGDIIRFGFQGLPYELDVESPQQLSYRPVQQITYTQPLTVIEDQTSSFTQRSPLPHLSSTQNTVDSSPWGTQTVPLPRPPTAIRARPISAGSRKSNLEKTGSPHGSPPVQHRSISGGGWIGRPGGARSQGNSPTNEILLLQEKEQKILSLGDEVNRLRLFEGESNRKDQIIAQFREEIADLQNKLRQSQTKTGYASDQDVTQKLLQLENEVLSKRLEVSTLQDELRCIKNNKKEKGSNEQINTSIVEASHLKSQLDMVTKDKNITSGLVTTMQRDMSNKDLTINRLTKDMDMLKKSLREKDIQISAWSTKFARLKENKQVDEEKDAREKELISLRNRFKLTENKVQEQKELIGGMTKEMEKLKIQMYDDKEIIKKVSLELDQTKSKYLDMQRAERVVRVDLEQASKKSERFRNRVIQVTYSTPGIRAPDDEISDSDLLDQLKKTIDERTEFSRQIMDLKETLKLEKSSKKEVNEGIKKLKQHLTSINTRLGQKGRLAGKLKSEVSLLNSVRIDESLQWIKESLLKILEGEIEWQKKIEDALQECGVNTKISDDEPGKHILALFSKWESSLKEKDSLNNHMKHLESQHKEEMKLRLENVQKDMENKLTDAVEKAKLEGEEKMNKAIDEIRLVEQEKRENALQQEKIKYEELQGNLDELRKVMVEMEDENKEQLAEAAKSIEELEEHKKLYADMKEQLEKTISEQAEEISNLQGNSDSLSKSHSSEMLGYKEQIKQHSVTICAMEERLNKVMKKNKEYQAEITGLRKSMQELKNKPAPKPVPPPKPKVIVQTPGPEVLAMEQVILALRKENADFKKQLVEQQDMVLSLRRDLSGASARLSDMTGELSEAQKEELERNKVKMREQHDELNDVRQQMVKLSQIIDKQAAEIKEMTDEMNRQKLGIQKYKNSMNDKETQIKTLEARLKAEMEEKSTQFDHKEKEGRITQEMTSLGAQCRGERHDQVIARQREALAELRSRIKNLETTRPAVPNHDQALQQVILLKKELAEMRTAQALAEQQKAILGSEASSTLDREVNRVRGLTTTGSADAEVERSAHRETLDSLEASESSYLTLLRAVASCLEMEEISGLRTMAHLHRDERERLNNERERATELVASRIKVLQERIQRKDELLHNYERDLAKLRQLEELASKKHGQVEGLENDVRGRTEEAQYLRESLNRTRDRLEQEKRLNSAIKQRKTFHLEQEKVHQQSYAKHHCPPEDIFGKKAAKKKVMNDKMKRKSYEIGVLKDALTDKDNHLKTTSSRLHKLETSLGLQNDRIEIME
ncbi:unnamed protein product [Owenia fusiformis]|uniref:Uncharacterized protein n=1 Tax=Owenia fusiformis TaxID=6347 RepID=A0A8J1Y9E1_OWEFU|nr:unnamed protein product [Owenia fusiformis]